MSQKSSLPQVTQFVSGALPPDRGQLGYDLRNPGLRVNTSWHTFQYLNNLSLGLQSRPKAPSRVHSTTEGFFFSGNVQLHMVSNSRK
jgi:hypothetical protein